VARPLLPLGSVIATVGFMGAFTLPFLTLFLSTAVGADPARTALYLFLVPLAGIALATMLGRWSDRPGRRRPALLLPVLAGAAGYAAFAVVRDFWLLLAVAVTVVAASGAAFPQSFAFARAVLDGQGSTRTPAVMNVLRMLVSVAWVAGPPVAAVTLAALDFTGFYLVVAAGYVVAALILVTRVAEPPPRPEPADPDAPDGAAPGATLWLAAAAFFLIQAAAGLNILAMPLYLTADLHGSVHDAGWVLALCALLEIPLMLGMGALTARIPVRHLVVAGTGVGVGYFVLVAVAQSTWHVMAAQVLNACFIAASAGLGISYVQDLLPGAPGRATTTFANTHRLSGMLAGPLLSLSQHLGYRSAYAAGALLCGGGLLLLLAVPAGAGPVRTATGAAARSGP